MILQPRRPASLDPTGLVGDRFATTTPDPERREHGLRRGGPRV